MTNPIYKNLETEIKEIHQLGNAMSMLAWDMRTYMPSDGIDQRSSVISLLHRMTHEKLTNPKIGKNLVSLQKVKNLTPDQKRELTLFRREYNREVKLPNTLVQNLSKQSMLTEHKWQSAKKKSDFSLVKGDLEQLVELMKEKARILDPNKDPWDVLAHEFEPNVTAAEITSFFDPLKAGVLKLINRYNTAMENCDEVPHLNLLKVPTDRELMKQLSAWEMELIGLPPEKSRIDVSAHPFTTGYMNDVRITTHYLDGDPTASIYSTLHEGGHAMYDLNLPQQYAWTLRGGAVSAGIHESQSRFIENIIGKNPAFLEYFVPKLKQYIPAFKSFSTYDFTRAINAIIPSKVRIYADEVTYNLHIILRFEIERDLFAGKISVDELPQVWNDKMDRYLGQTIKNDAEGVLQDTHWYSGLFGYFPDYALGNLYNAQMLHVMKHEIPDYEDQFREGNLSNVLNWLKVNVQQKGNMLDPLDFIKDVSGEPLNPHYFIDYCDLKFTKIYDLG